MDLLAQPRQVFSNILAATGERSQSAEEERANSLSHGLGLAAALAAGTLLIVTAAQRGNALFVVGTTVYAAALVALYLASTLYHALPVGPAKSAWLVCDHAAIYLVIAGTYTPFALGVLRGAWGSAVLVMIWGLALGGVAFKLVSGAERYPKLSTGLYLGMGWVLLLAAVPVWRLMPLAGLLWLLVGGAAYTLGVPFFRAERMRYAHFIWHLFVLAGTACHFVAVLFYASGH
jgi:hemolysin III